jgi:hypothetical protein
MWISSCALDSPTGLYVVKKAHVENSIIEIRNVIASDMNCQHKIMSVLDIYKFAVLQSKTKASVPAVGYFKRNWHLVSKKDLLKHPKFAEACPDLIANKNSEFAHTCPLNRIIKRKQRGLVSVEEETFRIRDLEGEIFLELGLGTLYGENRPRNLTLQNFGNTRPIHYLSGSYPVSAVSSGRVLTASAINPSLKRAASYPEAYEACSKLDDQNQ